MTKNDIQPERWDVYVSCSDADQDWVQDWLSPRLTRAGLRVQVNYRLRPGKARVRNISEAIAHSQCTLVVLTPEWVASEWQDFEGSLAILDDLAARKGQVIPLILGECEVPKHLAFRQSVNFRQKNKWESQCRWLILAILELVAVPFPLGPGHSARTWLPWRNWLWRYRRRLLLGLAASVCAVLAILIVFGIPPFHSQPGWKRLSLQAQGVWRLARFGDVLLAATSTTSGCNTEDTGLWRSTDQGNNWDPVPMPWLKISSTSGCQLAAIYKFAAVPGYLYAVTTNVGLLKGNSAGDDWKPVQAPELPLDLFSIAALDGGPETIFVTGQTEGLFRRVAPDQEWTRLDGGKTCRDNGEWSSLPLGAARKAHVLTNKGLVFVASPQVNYDAPAILETAGIYVSQDRGNCWQRIHNADGRWMYTTLAATPQAPDQLFFAAIERDQWDVFNPAHQIVEQINWRTKGATTLWDVKDIQFGWQLNLYVDPQGKSWYLATGVGQVVTGPTGQARATFLGSGLGLVACRLWRPCYADLAEDYESDIPLLLADEGIYQRSQVPWIRTIFP